MLNPNQVPLFPTDQAGHRLAIREVTPRFAAANEAFPSVSWRFALRVAGNTVAGAAFMAGLLMAPWALQWLAGL